MLECWSVGVLECWECGSVVPEKCNVQGAVSVYGILMPDLSLSVFNSSYIVP